MCSILPLNPFSLSSILTVNSIRPPDGCFYGNFRDRAIVLGMARPLGKFERQTTRLLEQLRYLGTEKSNQELANDLGVGVTQISNYIKYLKLSGAIEVKVVRTNFQGRIFSRRSIKVMK